jgi:hypothetical protein
LEKYGIARQATDDNTIQRMRFACLIIKTYRLLTQRICDTHYLSTVTMVTRTPRNVMLSTHYVLFFLSCIRVAPSRQIHFRILSSPTGERQGVQHHGKQERPRCPFNTGLVTLARCSVAQRTAAVHFYCNAKSAIRTQRWLRQQFSVPSHGAIPSSDRILPWIRKFEDAGSVRDSPHGSSRSVRNEMFAQQGNHFSAAHVAQIYNIHASWA